MAAMPAQVQHTVEWQGCRASMRGVRTECSVDEGSAAVKVKEGINGMMTTGAARLVLFAGKPAGKRQGKEWGAESFLAAA